MCVIVQTVECMAERVNVIDVGEGAREDLSSRQTRLESERRGKGEPGAGSPSDRRTMSGPSPTQP